MSQHRNEEALVYRFEGRLHRIEMVGPVADGVRMHSHFAGTITAGALEGARVDGVDYFRVRYDGVGVVDGRELITAGGRTISVSLTGYILPPEGMTPPTAEQLTSPDFAWPDADFRVQVLATFSTAAPDLQHLNSLLVTHSGTVNMASGALVIEARRFPAYRPAGSRPALAEV